MGIADAKRIIEEAEFAKLETLNLLSLELSTKDLKTLIPLIAETSVTKLYLNNNPFQYLPETIDQLQKLTYLNIRAKRLKTLPNSIGKLTKLTELHVNGRSFTTLPESIGELINLTKLNVTGNSFVNMPPSIGDLTNLTKLTITGNSFTILPESLGKLKKLTELRVSGLFFKHLPFSISKLRNLTELYIRGKSFSYLPLGIGDLANLTGLYISSNSLKELPLTIGKLTNLTKLTISGNHFANLPKSIGDLTNLTHLNLLNSPIRELPETLAQLQNLQKINLTNCPLSDHTKIRLDQTLPEIVTYNTALPSDGQPFEKVLGMLYTDTDEQKFIREKIENCDLDSGDIYYGGASQAQSKPAKEIIKEYLGNVQILNQHDLEFYGPAIKSTLDSILNEEHFSKAERANNLAIMTIRMGDCPTPIREGLSQEVVKQLLLQDNPLSEINQTIIEREAIRDSISLLEGYKTNEPIEQVHGLLNAIYLKGADENPNNPNLRILNRGTRLPSITPNIDFGFEIIQNNPVLLENFTRMVCQTDANNKPISRYGNYCLDSKKIKKIKDQYIAAFKFETEQQKATKKDLDKFTLPINQRPARPKSPNRSDKKQTDEARLTPKR